VNTSTRANVTAAGTPPNSGAKSSKTRPLFRKIRFFRHWELTLSVVKISIEETSLTAIEKGLPAASRRSKKTHSQEASPGWWGRSRPDPFAAVWPVLPGWLEEKPDSNYVTYKDWVCCVLKGILGRIATKSTERSLLEARGGAKAQIDWLSAKPEESDTRSYTGIVGLDSPNYQRQQPKLPADNWG
jgi:hypothetical protein